MVVEADFSSAYTDAFLAMETVNKIAILIIVLSLLYLSSVVAVLVIVHQSQLSWSIYFCHWQVILNTVWNINCFLLYFN